MMRNLWDRVVLQNDDPGDGGGSPGADGAGADGASGTTDPSDGGDTGAGAQGSAGEEPAAVVGAPEVYGSITFQEGYELEQEAFESLTSMARELNLDQAGLEKLYGLLTANAQRSAEASAKLDQQRANEADAALAEHPKLGLNNLEATKHSMNEVFVDSRLAEYASEARKELAQVGLDKHPAVVGLLSKIGSMMRADQTGGAGGMSATGNQGPQSIGAALYPELNS